MIRIFFRSIAINLAGVYIAAKILSGIVTISDGFKTLVVAAFAVSVINLLVKPIINLLLLPINLVTLGLFRWVANLLILYLVTWLVPGFQIHAFVSSEMNLSYVIVPSIHFSAFGAFIVATITLSIVYHFLYWLLQD